MRTYPGKVTRITLANGETGYMTGDGKLQLPETDGELAFGAIRILMGEEQLLVFKPLAIVLTNEAILNQDIPEEEEIPEVDR